MSGFSGRRHITRDPLHVRGIDATAQWGGLTPAQVSLAVCYYGDFREEIDEGIDANRNEAERLQAVWERAREALG